MSEKKEISLTQRALLAMGVWMIFTIVWSYFFRPQTPAPAPEGTPPAVSAPAGQAPAPAPEKKSPPAARPAAAPAPPPPAAISAAEESALRLENSLYSVEFSSRGGVVRSWKLKKYFDHQGKELELTNRAAAEQVGGWPLSFLLDDRELEKRLNTALFQTTPAGPLLRAPAEIRFEWSDGRLYACKRLRFTDDYVADVESSVQLDGQPLAHALAWRGGFGDFTEENHANLVHVFYSQDAKLNSLASDKAGLPDQRDQRIRQEGSPRFAGIFDHYFAAAFLPRGANENEMGAGVALWHWTSQAELAIKGKKEKQPVLEMAAGSTVPGPLAFRLFVGPKALDELRATRPPLTDLVQFGWFGIISEPLFYFLKWLYNYVPNYGWAIVVMTIAINLLMFPLKVSSWRMMQKMQKVAPEIKQIQEKYKKYSMTDPRRQEMQEEVMKIYRREGVNPMGSCLPMLLQMPIWIALYQMLNAVIELRHAPWILWLHDLSAKDPYYILPVLMGVTMYISQKMTPMTTADPAQQRMMQMMPIMFGGMFVIFPVSSGLVLYILASNIFAMIQQWYLNRSMPAAASGRQERKK